MTHPQVCLQDIQHLLPWLKAPPAKATEISEAEAVELHRQLVLLANGLPCPGLVGQRIDKPTAHSVVPLQLEGKAASHRERVTDNVPSSIPIDYLGHYTVLGKVDVTQGLEPNTKIIGYFFFGTLEVIGSSQSLLCPQLKRLRTSKGWVTWRPTLLEKIDASTAWVAEAAPEDSAQTAQSPVAAQTNAADISTTSETETADEPPAVDDLEEGGYSGYEKKRRRQPHRAADARCLI